MQYVLVSICLWFTLTSCTAASISQSNPHSLRIVPSNDSLQIIERVAAFIEWYRDHYKQANAYILVDIDQHGHYQVNIDKCTSFLTFIQSSGFVSDEYVRLWLEYFEHRKEAFEIIPQDEGPPEGFSFDFIVLNQEPELVFQDLGRFEYPFIQFDGSAATLRLKTTYWSYDVELSEIEGVWMIDYISIPDYE